MRIDKAVFESFSAIKVGFSGGLDSTVLLHVLLSDPKLRDKITALHVNHGLSSQAKAWEQHCIDFCAQHAVNIKTSTVVIPNSSNIELQARKSRYDVFLNNLSEGECLVLGHHLQDQAETLLLNLLRGTGVNGLAAIPYERMLGKGVLLRPLLNIDRAALLEYAKNFQLSWVEDSSNQDRYYSRNYIRHEIVPKMTSRWPNSLQNIADCASRCQIDRDNLQQLAQIDCPELARDVAKLPIKNLDSKRMLNLLHTWLDWNGVATPSAKILHAIITEVIQAAPDAQPKLVIGQVKVQRYQNNLYLVSNDDFNSENLHWENFPEPLHLADGRIIIAEEATNGVAIAATDNIWVKFRQGGERILHNQQHKSVKKLLQQHKILPWERAKLPLIFVAERLVALAGVQTADSLVSATKYSFKVQRIGAF